MIAGFLHPGMTKMRRQASHVISVMNKSNVAGKTAAIFLRKFCGFAVILHIPL
jgi:hypothetical protein